MSPKVWKRMDSAGKIQAWPVGDELVIKQYPMLPPFMLSKGTIIVNSWAGATFVNLGYLCCIATSNEVLALDGELTAAYFTTLQRRLTTGETLESLVLAGAMETVWQFLNCRAIDLVSKVEAMQQEALGCQPGTLSLLRARAAIVKNEVSFTCSVARSIQSAIRGVGDGCSELAAYEPLLMGVSQCLKLSKKSSIECVEEIVKARMSRLSAQREITMLVIAAATFCVTSMFNIVTGLFGMNVPNGHETDNNFFFGKVIAICSGGSLGLFLFSLFCVEKLGLLQGLFGHS